MSSACLSLPARCIQGLMSAYEMCEQLHVMTACMPSQLCPVHANRQAYIMKSTYCGPNSIHALLHFDRVALAPKPD